MKIDSAIRIALKIQCEIRRECWPERIGLKVTCEENPIYLLIDGDAGKNENNRPRCWNPKPVELMADDWKLTKV